MQIPNNDENDQKAARLTGLFNFLLIFIPFHFLIHNNSAFFRELDDGFLLEQA